MEPTLRRLFNAAYSDAVYERYKKRLRDRVGDVPFRLAETPVFLPLALRDKLEVHAGEILAKLSERTSIDRMTPAIPARFHAPGMDLLPTCAQVDFAIVRGPGGELDGRIVELQGFPSLYAFSVEQARSWDEVLAELPGLSGPSFHPYFDGLDEAKAILRLKKTILAGHDPFEVVLLDLDPESQKTRPDFQATRTLLGIDAVCPTELVREGRCLLRRKNGRLVPIRRIFNRVVFDELEAKRPSLPFAYTDALDVSWCPHPNWYWVWSKYSLPALIHEAIPRATLLSELAEVPEDLSRYVLKPLFSFAGGGVKIDVTRADVDAVPAEARGEWLLQEKIEYARELVTPEGHKVAVEVRVMCLRAPGEPELRPSWNLIRLSRGKMHGVDHNRDLSWVGSSIGLWR